jgi:transposase-like protein
LVLTEHKVAVTCKYCGLTEVTKCGSYNGIPRYWCKLCHHKFKADDHLFHMGVPLLCVSDTLNMYYRGIEISQIREHLNKTHNYYPRRSVVHQWIDKYTNRAVTSLKGDFPKVGDIWIASETMLKQNKINIWLFDVMDIKTGFLLASRAVTKRKVEAFKLTLQNAFSRSGKEPKLIIAYMSYYAFDALERRAIECKAEHINRKKASISGENKEAVESFVTVIGERKLILRKLRTIDSVNKFLDGWSVHHNYFKSFKLNGISPALSAGIEPVFKCWKDVCQRTTPIVKSVTNNVL